MRTISEIIPDALQLAHKSANDISPDKETPVTPEPSEPKDSTKPPTFTSAKTAWQRRWLDLDITTPELQNLADDIQGFAARFSQMQKREHIILSGRSGTGKTHCAERLYQWADSIRIALLDHGKWAVPPRVEWIEFARVAFLPEEEFRHWLDDRCDTQLLFIEDLGTEVDRFKTGEPAERLRQILNEFKHKRLFITTNILPEHWQSHWDDRISDRLMRDMTIITLRKTPRYTERMS